MKGDGINAAGPSNAAARVQQVSPAGLMSALGVDSFTTLPVKLICPVEMRVAVKNASVQSGL